MCKEEYKKYVTITAKKGQNCTHRTVTSEYSVSDEKATR